MINHGPSGGDHKCFLGAEYVEDYNFVTSDEAGDEAGEYPFPIAFGYEPCPPTTFSTREQFPDVKSESVGFFCFLLTIFPVPACYAQNSDLPLKTDGSKHIAAGKHKEDRGMGNIEDYGFERSDLVVATAVNGYLKNLTPAARKETLEGIVKQNGAETVIDGPALAQLIEDAKAAAMISADAWKDGGDPLMKKTLSFIREILPSVDGKEYAKNLPKGFLQFLEDCVKQ